ncbi:MAG TPA: serine/threonine-protein kinase [Kofleriaceae bacterium]|nr:serine/threonine-protein kinase [Kofleriaceae bacterium]
MVDDGTDETLRQAPDTLSPTTAPVRGERREAQVELDARYRLGELLGKGGMGEVVLAYDEQIGREVAVKRIRSAEPTAEERARFVREARVQGRLEHPAVVPVHDLAIDREGNPFFVMKRLSGTVMTDLLERLRDGAIGDEAAARRRLLRAFAEVCLAIELAHSKGVIHRDLKPANIMLGDFGEVYVLDWGIARALSEPDDDRPAGPRDLQLSTGETRAGTVLGTPAYMAPEQLAGDRAGPAADIYALGCILYEIAAGEPLHQGQRAYASEVDATPSRVRPDVAPELDAICVRATQLDPRDRHGSARALGAEVQAYLDGDRDIAVRRQLAIDHIVAARAALAEGDHEHCRRSAMRAAGRALALDPTAHEAADLVSHLVLRPPAAPPAEVEHALDQIDTDTARQQGRLGALALVGYLAFIPLLLWSGVRDAGLVIAFAGLALGSALHVLVLVRRDRLKASSIYLNACINAVLIGLICRMLGPFIIAPTLAITTLSAYAAHPRFGRIGVIALILAASVAVPWLLEAVGVLAPTYSFEGGALVLRSPVIAFRSAPVQVAFAVLLVVLLAVVAMLSRSMAQRQRAASRRVELQAWHLRQLVPSRD